MQMPGIEGNPVCLLSGYAQGQVELSCLSYHYKYCGFLLNTTLFKYLFALSFHNSRLTLSF